APPPSSGGLVVSQVLGILENLGFSDAGAGDPMNWALFAEAQQLGYADWETHIGDDRFVPVPVEGLSSPAYHAARAALVSRERPMADAPPGDPWAFQD